MTDPWNLVPIGQTMLTSEWVPFDNDPSANPFLATTDWLQGTLLGSIATSIALIAVASVGLMMLRGRLPLRRGATVVAGCFLLFGASSVATGLARLATRVSGGSDHVETRPLATAPTPPQNAAVPPTTYDPYAGAAVPQR